MPLSLADLRRRNRARRAGKKLSQAEAHYRKAEKPDRRSCGGCDMYAKPHACTLVAGKIATDHVCNFFEAR